MIPAALPPTPAHQAQEHGHCRTHRCWHRISIRRHIRWAWRFYKAHPMPTCTWEPESSWDPITGRSFFGRPWARGRYRVRNQHSTAGGKFQVLNTTWVRNGGTAYRDTHPAAAAPALEQERVARVVLRRGGLSQWVGC